MTRLPKKLYRVTREGGAPAGYLAPMGKTFASLLYAKEHQQAIVRQGGASRILVCTPEWVELDD